MTFTRVYHHFENYLLFKKSFSKNINKLYANSGTSLKLYAQFIQHFTFSKKWKRTTVCLW
jgi:hypothetical protein